MKWVPLSSIDVCVYRTGLLGGFMRPRQVIDLALARMNDGIPISQIEESFALALSDEADTVEEALRSLDVDDREDLRARKIWFFATASELYDGWLLTDGPELLYEILESLDLSDEFPELVYFSPVGFLGAFRKSAPLRNRLRVRLGSCRRW